MKKALLSICVFLSACSPYDSKKEGPPQTYSDIPYIDFNADVPDLYVLGAGNSNYQEVNLAYNESQLVTVKLRSQGTTSEVYKIVSPAFEAISSACIKKIENNEECSFDVNIAADKKGLLVVRMATNKGLKYIVFDVKRTSGPSGLFSIDQSAHVIGTVNAKTPVRKVITVINEGSSNLTLNVQRTGRDNVVLLQSNTCVNVKPRKRCYVIYRIHGINKTDGVYEDALTLSSGATSHVVSVDDVQFTHSALPNELPVFGNQELKVVQAESKTLSVAATDADGDSLTYGFVSNDDVVVSEFNASTGSFKALVPTLGTYSLEVWVSDGKGPVVNKTYSIRSFPQMVMNKKTFTEGEVQEPLYTIVFNSLGLGITSNSTNMADIFTLIKIQGTGSTYTTEATGLVGNSLPLNGTASFNLNFAGAVKAAGNKTLSIVINFGDGSSYDYQIPITVESTGLPLVRYDMTLAKNSAHTTTDKNLMRNNLMNYIGETKRTYGSWRVPIFERFKYEEVVCSGVAMNTYDGTETHDACLRSRVSADAESVFAFVRAYIDSDEIGGVALGLRSGVVISGRGGRQTVVAHELGHNFGLWHTFESYFNSTIIQNDSSGLYLRNIYMNTTGNASTIVGDFANTIINPSSSSPFTLPWTYNIADDTPIDFYAARRVPYAPVCFLGNCTTQHGYAQNDIMFLVYGQDSNAVCQQSFGSVPYSYPVMCNFNLASYPSRHLEEEVVKNVMSYWDKPASTSLFSTGQKLRMDNQLSRYPEITNP